MQQQIENYIEYLFSLALQKSGNLSDAEDLTHDVLLAAYVHLNKGGKIENMKSWLSGTLNHKYYDMLRKKYKMPMVSIDFIPEQPVWDDDPIDKLTAEQVREEIARALGISTPYIEKAVEDLVKSELMSSVGNKVFTDFMITHPKELLENLEQEIEFVENNYNLIWGVISEAVAELKLELGKNIG